MSMTDSFARGPESPTDGFAPEATRMNPSNVPSGMLNPDDGYFFSRDFNDSMNEGWNADGNNDIGDPNHPIWYPFTCTCHGLGFQKKPDLNRHTAKHTRKFECDIHECPSTGPDGLPPCFGTANDKKRHYRDVHNMDSRGNAVERFFCTHRTCKRFTEGFPRRQNLESHLANIHGGQAPDTTPAGAVEPAETVAGPSTLPTDAQPAAYVATPGPSTQAPSQRAVPGLTPEPSLDSQALPDDEKDDDVLVAYEQDIADLRHKIEGAAGRLVTLESEFTDLQGEHEKYKMQEEYLNSRLRARRDMIRKRRAAKKQPVEKG